MNQLSTQRKKMLKNNDTICLGRIHTKSKRDATISAINLSVLGNKVLLKACLKLYMKAIEAYNNPQKSYTVSLVNHARYPVSLLITFAKQPENKKVSNLMYSLFFCNTAKKLYKKVSAPNTKSINCDYNDLNTLSNSITAMLGIIDMKRINIPQAFTLNYLFMDIINYIKQTDNVDDGYLIDNNGNKVDTNTSKSFLVKTTNLSGGLNITKCFINITNKKIHTAIKSSLSNYDSVDKCIALKQQHCIITDPMTKKKIHINISQIDKDSLNQFNKYNNIDVVNIWNVFTEAVKTKTSLVLSFNNTITLLNTLIFSLVLATDTKQVEATNFYYEFVSIMKSVVNKMRNQYHIFLGNNSNNDLHTQTQKMLNNHYVSTVGKKQVESSKTKNIGCINISIPAVKKIVLNSLIAFVKISQGINDHQKTKIVRLIDGKKYAINLITLSKKSDFQDPNEQLFCRNICSNLINKIKNNALYLSVDKIRMSVIMDALEVVFNEEDIRHIAYYELQKQTIDYALSDTIDKVDEYLLNANKANKVNQYMSDMLDNNKPYTIINIKSIGKSIIFNLTYGTIKATAVMDVVYYAELRKAVDKHQKAFLLQIGDEKMKTRVPKLSEKDKNLLHNRTTINHMQIIAQEMKHQPVLQLYPIDLHNIINTSNLLKKFAHIQHINIIKPINNLTNLCKNALRKF